jgi:hypothetical protein
MTKKKLYAVTVQYQAYVLAESESEAEDFASEITSTEDYTWISVAEANGKELGWKGECCVYHNGTGDISLDESLNNTTSESD